MGKSTRRMMVKTLQRMIIKQTANKMQLTHCHPQSQTNLSQFLISPSVSFWKRQHASMPQVCKNRTSFVWNTTRHTWMSEQMANSSSGKSRLLCHYLIGRACWDENVRSYGALYTYLQAKVDMGRVKSVADYRCFSSEFDLVRRALLYMALGHHFSADIFLAVETECDLLLVPRL